jgi:hypothetical protein
MGLLWLYLYLTYFRRTSGFTGLKTLAVVIEPYEHYTCITISVSVITAGSTANFQNRLVHPYNQPCTKYCGTVSHKPFLERSPKTRHAFQQSVSIYTEHMQYRRTVTWLGDRRGRSRGGVCTGDSRGATLWDGASLGERIVRVQLFESPSQVAVFSMQLLFVHWVFPLSVLQVLQQQQKTATLITRINFTSWSSIGANPCVCK